MLAGSVVGTDSQCKRSSVAGIESGSRPQIRTSAERQGWRSSLVGSGPKQIPAVKMAIKFRMAMLDLERSPLPIGGVMIGVFQGKVDDCMNACISTILEIPLFQRDFSSDWAWFEQLQCWLSERGLACTPIMSLPTTPDGDTITPEKAFPGITIGSIASNIPGKRHAVVCRDGKIVWDPKTGECDGTFYADDFMVIYPLDIVRCAR